MSLLKYFDARPLRTEDGFPLRSNFAPNLKQEEYEDLPLSADAKVKIFDLSKPEDLAAYTEVLDHIANGDWYRLAPDKEMEDRDKKTWLILCRYAEIKGDVPAHLLRGF